ncbi:MAG: transglycosylase SLT domain-containing protein [Deltaproteobacteria bacterium]|nr:transglycosylase SLT domain-containing protein [Deltaproteobacteria bacterium]
MKKTIVLLILVTAAWCKSAAAEPLYPYADGCIFTDCGENTRSSAPGWDSLSPEAPACGDIPADNPAAAGEEEQSYGYNEEPYLDVPVVMNPKVENYMEYFQARGRKVFTRWLERSQAYLPMVKEILSGTGLPADLAYLALIESGFNPNARSRARAVGMWQFISGTAKKYGLKVNWWIDERRDPEKATIAAASYLKDLYGIFNSWDLAAASYNAGEGRISRAMVKYKTEDFWELASKKKAIKSETRDYVPKYIAAMLMAKDPEGYGFTELNYMEPLSYEKVSVHEPTDLKVIAWAAGTTVEEIDLLNPELLHWFTPPDYPDYRIKIPAGTKKLFDERMAQVPKPEKLKFHEHKLKKGETLAQVARLYKTDIKQIMYLNEIKNPRSIRTGRVIVVPVRPRDNTKHAEAVPPAPKTYTVRKGDTLWEISRRFDVGLEDIVKINDLRTSGSIMPGHVIYLKEASLDTTEKSKN